MLISVAVAVACLLTLEVTQLRGNSINTPLTLTRINDGDQRASVRNYTATDNSERLKEPLAVGAR